LFDYSNVASPQREKLFAKIASFSKWRITSHKIGQISSPDKKSKSVSDQVVRNIKLSESRVARDDDWREAQNNFLSLSIHFFFYSLTSFFISVPFETFFC